MPWDCQYDVSRCHSGTEKPVLGVRWADVHQHAESTTHRAAFCFHFASRSREHLNVGLTDALNSPRRNGTEIIMPFVHVDQRQLPVLTGHAKRSLP